MNQNVPADINPHPLLTFALDERQIKLLLYYLENLSNNLANNGCNDLPSECRDMFTNEEGAVIAKEFAVYNNPTEPDGPSWPLPDFCLLYWLQRKITDQTKSSNETSQIHTI